MKNFIPAAARNNTNPHFVDFRTDRIIRPGYDRLTTRRFNPVRRSRFHQLNDYLVACGARPLNFPYFFQKKGELKFWSAASCDLELTPAIRDYATLALGEILGVPVAA